MEPEHSNYVLTQDGCYLRRNRLMALRSQLQLENILITDHRDVYYFSGCLFPPDLPVALFLDHQDDFVLIAPATHGAQSQITTLPYSWNIQGTRDPDITAKFITVLSTVLSKCKAGTVGIQSSSCTQAIGELFFDLGCRRFISIDDHLSEFQNRKDPDEVLLIRQSIRANLDAYASIERMLRPGVTELEVLAAGWRGATLAAGEKIFHDGDYQSGQFNGPARNRNILVGELYIIDAWTCYRGFWSDLSRTFYVGKKPLEIQVELYNHIRSVLLEVTDVLKPGVDGCDIFRWLDNKIREFPQLALRGLVHHGGHAIGLRAHEMPDINRERGGTLQTGNILCVEPGGYFPDANYGVRLENMFLITETGCENLCPEIPDLQCFE